MHAVYFVSSLLLFVQFRVVANRSIVSADDIANGEWVGILNAYGPSGGGPGVSE